MVRKKQKAIVIGSMMDPAKQIWSPNAHAFETAKDAVEYLGTEDSYYEDLAYELRVKPEELPDALDRMDPVRTMEALIRVLQMHPGISIKAFSRFRDAEAFLDFIEQMALQYEKERN